MYWRVRKAWEWWLPVSYALAMGCAIFVLASTPIGNGGKLYWMYVHVHVCVHVYVCMCACVYWLVHSYYFPSKTPISYRVHVQWPCCWLPVQYALHVCPVCQLHWQHDGGYVWTVPSTVLPGSYPATGQPWYMQRYVSDRCSLSKIFIDALFSVSRNTHL